MDSNTLPLGPALDSWLTRLEQEGFEVGIRERLLVQTLLARLSAVGELPPNSPLIDILNLAGPLLCSQPTQQRRYAALLPEFVEQAKSRSLDPEKNFPGGKGDVTQERRLSRLQTVTLVVALCGAVGAGLWWWISSSPTPPLPPPQDIEQKAQDTAGLAPQPIAQPIYVPPSSFPIEVGPETQIPAWIASLYISVLTLLGLSALGLGWLAWSRFRRQLYLHGVRTDKEIEERFLTDPHPASIEPSPLVVRRASRILRQRYAGQGEVLDVSATLHATIKTGGALAPRFRAIVQTPEYLALIDQRHRADHLTNYSEALIVALERHGVTAQRYYFDRSPQTGCWRQRVGLGGRERFDRTTFAELAARCAGQRLLVFAEAEALAVEGSGRPQKWTTDLRSFPQRAWLTPIPLGSWGSMEQLADEQGFLILPLQPESLNMVADWFSASQLGLEVDIDWPMSYPRLLQEEAVAWVVRQTAPPPNVQDELLFQLRNYLGAKQFQWLCACAIFPAITPSITLKLGRELVTSARELALGAVAIGALPWFRWAFMPAWLRQALIDRLDPTHEVRFRQIVEAQLDSALEDSAAPSLATIAQKRRRRWAWFHRQRGLARDVVLVEFLQRHHPTRLAQRLPERLRKRLFGPSQKLPEEPVEKLILRLPRYVLVSLIVVPGVLAIVNSSQLDPPVHRFTPLTGHSAAVAAAHFSPDGTKIVTASADTTARLWEVSSGKLLATLTGHSNSVTEAQFSPDGTKVVTVSADKTARLWEVASGKLLVTVSGQNDHASSVSASGFFFAQFSPDGTKIVMATDDTTPRLWEVASGQLVATLTGHSSIVTDAQFSPDGTKIVTASVDGSARLWEMPSSQLLATLTGHNNSVGNPHFSPDGTMIVTVSLDRTARLWEVPSGKLLATLTGHNDTVSDALFSPDSTKIVTASDDKTARLWEVSSGQLLASLTGHSSFLVDAQFSPDGTKIVTASHDTTARLWEVPSGTLVATFTGHSDGITNAQFSPDGTKIVTASNDKTVRLWGQLSLPKLDLVDCEAERGVTTKVIRLTDELNKSDLRNKLAPVAYHPNAWRIPSERSLPPYGTVLYSSSENQATAEALATWLTNNFQPKSDTNTSWKATLDSTLNPHTFVTNLCATPSPHEQPVAITKNPAIQPFRAFAYYRFENKRYFKKVQGDPAANPDKGDIVEALTAVNARKGYWTERQGLSPVVGTIQQGEQVRVVDVRDVTGSAGFMWIEFERFAQTRENPIPSPKQSKDIMRDVLTNFELPPDAPKPVEISPEASPLKAQIIKLPEVPVVAETKETVGKPAVAPPSSSLTGELAKELDEELKKIKKFELAKQAPPAKASVEPLPRIEAKTSSLRTIDTTLKAPGVVPGSNAYLARIRQRISSFWTAPVVDMTNHVYVVTVQFRLHRNGTVTGVAVEQSSGNEHYDLAGMRAVKSAVPLPPFPSDITDAYFDAHFTFTVGEPLDSNETAATQQKSRPLATRPFHAFAYYRSDSKRYFKRLQGDPAANPVKGDIVEALTAVNARQGFMDLYGNRPPVIGTIQPGEQLRVLGVKDVTEGNGYIWIEFEKLDTASKPVQTTLSPQQQLSTPKQAQ